VQQLVKHGFFRDDDRLLGDAFLPTHGQDILGQTVVGDSVSYRDNTRHGIWTQSRLLVNREVTYNYRFPAPVYARLGISGFLAAMVGVIYWGVGESDPANQFNLTSQLGAIMILMVFSILGCAQPAILFFPEERPIFVREYSTNHYSVLPYFLSRLMVEVILTFLQIGIINVILYTCVKFRGRFWMFLLVSYALAMTSTAIAVTIGCLSRGNAKVAMQTLPIVLLPQFLFSGFFVSPDLIPKALQWMQYIAPLSYAVKLIAVEEFTNCSDNFFAQTNCNMLLDNLGADPDVVGWSWWALLGLFVGFRLLALWVLQRGAGKFY
jgi:ABC-type multidrug transport system permease subunit